MIEGAQRSNQPCPAKRRSLANRGARKDGYEAAPSGSCQQVGDGHVIERLGEVVVEVGFICLPAKVVMGVGRNDDEQDLRAVLAAELAGELIAVNGVASRCRALFFCFRLIQSAWDFVTQKG